MSEHTPGPWKAVEHETGWWSVIRGAWDVSHNYAAQPGVVADSKYSAMTPEENAVNARLIAAAPTQHKALRDLVEMVKREGEQLSGHWAEINLTEARAAIALASPQESEIRT